MAAIKKYFKKEFQVSMLKLEHDDLTDFYLSSCQKNRSPLPLLCIRVIVLLGCLGILLSSTIMTVSLMSFGHWFIYLTHWGVVLITLTSASASLLSLKAYLGIQNDTPTDLQVFAQIYWVLYNISVPLSFLITAFYWAFLTESDEDFAVDPILDVFIHGVNAVVMFVLVVFSRTPTRLLHVLHPLGLAIIYLLFSIIYYVAGGLSPFGSVYIYPTLDWSSPGAAIITVVGTSIFLVISHVLIFLISLCRDKLNKRFFKDTHSMNIYNDAYN